LLDKIDANDLTVLLLKLSTKHLETK